MGHEQAGERASIFFARNSLLALGWNLSLNTNVPVGGRLRERRAIFPAKNQLPSMLHFQQTAEALDSPQQQQQGKSGGRSLSWTKTSVSGNGNDMAWHGIKISIFTPVARHLPRFLPYLHHCRGASVALSIDG